MKKYFLIILIVLITTQFFGCTQNIDDNLLNDLENNLIEESVNNTEEIPEAPITVWGWELFDMRFSSQFEQKYPNIEFEFDSYDIWSSVESITNMLQEVVAGIGPDVIIINDPIDIYDFIAQDVFYDLTKYINDEKLFIKENYVEEVINCGRIDGKQLFIPTQFRIPAVIETVGEIINKHDLSLDEYLTWEKIKELGEIYTGENDSPYLFAPTLPGHALFGLCEEPLINYNLKVPNYSNPSFINLIEMSKTYFTSPQESLTRNKYTDTLDAFDNDIYLFYTYPLLSKSGIDKYMEWNYSYYIYPIQRPSGSKGITAEVNTMVGINKKAKNKDGCFDYINLLISDIAQLQNIYLPVNKKVYFNYLSYIENKYKDEDIGNFTKAIRNIYENIDSCYIYDEYNSIANRIYVDKKNTLKAIELAEKMDASILKRFELNNEK